MLRSVFLYAYHIPSSMRFCCTATVAAVVKCCAAVGGILHSMMSTHRKSVGLIDTHVFRSYEMCSGRETQMPQAWPAVQGGRSLSAAASHLAARPATSSSLLGPGKQGLEMVGESWKQSQSSLFMRHLPFLSHRRCPTRSARRPVVVDFLAASVSGSRSVAR